MAEPIININDLAQNQLNANLGHLEEALNADVLTFIGPILPGIDEVLRKLIESNEEKRKTLAVVLDTPGGVVEVVERMVDTIRHHYNDVSFVIPDRAMSAGTVFALSGDTIFMDYFSTLGPIDPQLQKGGKLIPALAYLVQYERLVEKSAKNQLTTAELALLQKLDLGELQQFEEARELSIDLLKKWLVKYKFKDWKETETTKQPVTETLKQQRAKQIAEVLCDHRRWHSHGRGIPMKELCGEEVKLKIDDFGKDSKLAKPIKAYFSIARDYMSLQANECTNFLHVREVPVCIPA